MRARVCVCIYGGGGRGEGVWLLDLYHMLQILISEAGGPKKKKGMGRIRFC